MKGRNTVQDYAPDDGVVEDNIWRPRHSCAVPHHLGKDAQISIKRPAIQESFTHSLDPTSTTNSATE